MKRIIASALASAAVLPLLWFNIIPWANDYCPRDSKGNLQAYSVQRTNGFGEIVTLVFGKQYTVGNPDGQTKLCQMVKEFPM